MIRCSRLNKSFNFFLQNVTSTPKYQKTKKLSIAGKPFAFKECSLLIVPSRFFPYTDCTAVLPAPPHLWCRQSLLRNQSSPSFSPDLFGAVIHKYTETPPAIWHHGTPIPAYINHFFMCTVLSNARRGCRGCNHFIQSLSLRHLNRYFPFP